MTSPATPATPASGPLTPDELLAFAGLARWLIQLDGRFTKDEAAVLEEAASDLFGKGQVGGGPYREQVDAANVGHEQDQQDMFALLEQAAVAMPDENAVRLKAQSVTRQEARELIFAVLYEVAASDVIAKSEWPLLDWLSKEWNVDVR